jgi:lysophospholipase L1-like esterase
MKKPLHYLSAFLLIAALGASSSLCAQGAPATAVNPATVPVPRNDWIVRHEGFNAIAKKGGVDLLFVGDSITDGWAKGGKAIWEARYAPLKAANFGIGGDKTEHVLWRLKNGNLNGIQPKVVVLMIGTNNNVRDTAPQIAEGISAIVQEIRNQSPASNILLLAVFPRAEKPTDAWRLKIIEVNKKIAQLDDGQHVHFLDIGQSFLQADGTMSKEVMPDFLHPGPAGYQIWADAMQAKLAELLK